MTPFKSLADEYKDTTRPNVFIQWKGMDACIDAYCSCGAQGHVDGDFIYFLKCGKCGQHYELGGHVQLYPVDESAATGNITYTFEDDQ